MALKDIQAAQERYKQIVAQARSANAKDNPKAHADFEAALEDEQAAVAQTRVEDTRAVAPSTVASTRDAAIEDLRSNIAKIEQLVGVSGLKTEELQSELTEMRKMAARVELPVGRSGKPIMTRELQSMIVTTSSNSPEIVDLQNAHDELALVNALVQQKAGRRHILPNMPSDVRQSKAFARYQKALCQVFEPDSVRALYSTGSNLGDELVPLELSSQIFEKFEMERRVAAVVPSFAMVRGEYKFPLQTADPTIYLQSERTSDPGADYRSSNLSTDQRTFACSTFAALQNISSEIDEDSIVPIAPLWGRRVAKAMAAAEEDVIINGDTSATHMDSDVTASDDVRKSMNGIRDYASQLTSTPTTVDLANWATNANATFVGMLAKMDDWGSDASQLVCVPSASVFWKLLCDNDRLVSAEKAGSLNAPILTGKVPVFFGMPVLTSGKVRINLNASGVYDGSTMTKTLVLVFKPDAYLIGRRRALQVQSQPDIKSGQTALVATMRMKLNKMESLTLGLTECVGYNIAE